MKVHLQIHKETREVALIFRQELKGVILGVICHSSFNFHFSRSLEIVLPSTEHEKG